MAAKLVIKDGNPVWLSASIIPSTDQVVSPNSSPQISAIHENSQNVFVYVKVENAGTVDLGLCSCSNVGPWAIPISFSGFLANASGNTSQTQSGVTFSATPLGDSLTGSGFSHPFGFPGSGRRAWAWSPDGRFFAYVASPNGPDWFLTIVTIQDVIRSDGSTVSKGQIIATANGIYAGPPDWTNDNFSWAGSKAVLAHGDYTGGTGLCRTLVCPESPIPNYYGELIPKTSGLDWAFLVSPCGGAVAFVPRILQASVGSRDLYIVSTANAKTIQLKMNNAPTSVSIVGANPSINTTQHAANGVQVNTGSGSLVSIDDPECTLVGGNVVVRVDRVKASTLPTANLGVLPVGVAYLGSLLASHSQWVQVKNSYDWNNQSENHWCLLAQAYTEDNTTIPRPWDGQAQNIPPFPLSNDNCAQRNIEILS
jgi:hypothetical protein